MIATREYISPISERKLCETFSTQTKKLLQLETGAVYSENAIDVTQGYDEEGRPFSPFTYRETDE